ncbi:hypothetical protein J6590_017977 [Homalodisca vitripennis]|nr:hypothetical protein J6590_017977 [Homalodisca vitripennis]
MSPRPCGSGSHAAPSRLPSAGQYARYLHRLEQSKQGRADGQTTDKGTEMTTISAPTPPQATVNIDLSRERASAHACGISPPSYRLAGYSLGRLQCKHPQIVHCQDHLQALLNSKLNS